MRPTARHLLAGCVAVTIVACTSAWLGARSGQAGAPADAPSITLTAGAAHDRELKRGDTHHYDIDLREGECVRALLELRGVNVRVAISGAGDGELLALTSTTAQGYGPEPIAFIAPSAGRVRVAIAPRNPIDGGGRYRLEVQAVRDPDADDRAYVEAVRAYAAGSLEILRPTDDSGPRALRHFQQAQAFWTARGDRRLQAHAQMAVGHIYRFHLYDHVHAAKEWNEAALLWRAIGDDWGEAVAQVQLSLALQTMGDVAGTIAARERALALHHAAGRRAEEGTALDALALIWIRLGEYQRALDLATEALARFREARQPQGEAFALTDIGLVHARLGEWEASLERYRQAQPLAEGDPSLSQIIQSQIGWVLFNLGDVDEARALLERSLAVHRERRYRLQEGNVLMNLTALYADQGDTAKAIEAGEAALTIFRSTGDIDGQAVIAGRLGALYARRGDAELARTTFATALALNPGANPRNDAALQRGLGEVARDAGRLSEARQHANDGIALVESLRARLESQRTRQSMLAVAQPLYELSVDILMREHVANQTAGHDAAALEVAERARARSLLELLGEGRGRIDVRTAADPALLDRDRALRTRLNLAAEALTQAQRARAAALAAAAKAPAPSGAAQAAAVRAATERVTTIEGQIADDMAALAQIEVSLRRASPRYADLTAPAPLSTAALQRDVLDADTQLIEVMLGEPSSYLWVLSPTTLTSYRLAPRDEIERAARLFYEAASAPPGAARGANDGRGRSRAGAEQAAPAAGSASPVTPEEYERRARALSDLVLGPAAATLTAKRLVIVAPGMLQYVPFAALPIPATTTASATFEPLMARYEVVTAPSASVVATLRRERAERKPAPKGIVILADPVFDAKDPRVEHSRAQGAAGVPQARGRNGPASRVRGAGAADAIGFGRLPFSRLEADAIVAAAPRGSAVKAVDFEASRAFATSAALADFRIVHFATHGVLHARQPDLSGVVLSLVDARGKPQEGFLRLHEIYNLHLNADLVVLSGCQTALGKAVRGEGLVGVTRGFMYAGSPRVIASLWQVDDLATSELMASFYRHLFGGQASPAAALRAAQLELARSRRWRSPYFWAAFVLQGDWQAPRSTASAAARAPASAATRAPAPTFAR